MIRGWAKGVNQNDDQEVAHSQSLQAPRRGKADSESGQRAPKSLVFCSERAPTRSAREARTRTRSRKQTNRHRRRQRHRNRHRRRQRHRDRHKHTETQTPTHTSTFTPTRAHPRAHSRDTKDRKRVGHPMRLRLAWGTVTLSSLARHFALAQVRGSVRSVFGPCSHQAVKQHGKDPLSGATRSFSPQWHLWSSGYDVSLTR